MDDFGGAGGQLMRLLGERHAKLEGKELKQLASEASHVA